MPSKILTAVENVSSRLEALNADSITSTPGTKSYAKQLFSPRCSSNRSSALSKKLVYRLENSWKDSWSEPSWAVVLDDRRVDEGVVRDRLKGVDGDVAAATAVTGELRMEREADDSSGRRVAEPSSLFIVG